MTYKTNKGYGGWVGLLLGIVVFGFIIWGINFSLDESDRTLKTLLNVPTYLFLAGYVYLVLGAFTLGYKMEEDGLVIVWGLQRKKITWDQFDEIIEIKGQPNLIPFLAVAWWGYIFGLYTVRGLGPVRMYATYTDDGFLYLKTKAGFFGISPADGSMLTALIAKTSRTVTSLDMDQMSEEEKGESIRDDSAFNMYYKLNLLFLGIFAGYLGIFFPGSDAPRFVVLLLVLAVVLFLFNVSNAKRLFQFSTLGAYFTLIIGMAVTGIFIILSLAEIGF